MEITHKSEIIKKFAINAKDTGSVQVQIALLTQRIKDISAHVGDFPKDFSSKRGLLKAVAQRRKFLTYLKKNNAAQYQQVIESLGLRK